MRNGMLTDLEFENQINNLGDNQLELIKFVARQQYGSTQIMLKHDIRITALETDSKRISGITGAISGTITGVIVGVISFFTGKG